MAHWLKWSAATAVGLVFVSVMAQQAADSIPAARMERPPEQVRVRALRTEMARLRLQATLIDRAEALAAVVQREPAVQLYAPALLVDVARTELLADAVAEAAAGAGRATSTPARVMVALVAPSAGLSSAQIYAGRDEAGPWCIAAHSTAVAAADTAFGWSLRGALDPRTGTHVSLLGVCRFWARYGAPGEAVSAWLASGGAPFGDALDTPAATLPITRQRGAFGVDERLGFPSIWHDSPTTRRCLTGDSPSCAAALQAGRAISHPENVDGMLMLVRRRTLPRYLGDRDATLLADMETDLGPERFARFWQGDGDLETAWAAADVTPLGDWVGEWAEQRYGRDTAGPRMPLGTLLMSMLVLPAAAGVGVVVAQRRQL